MLEEHTEINYPYQGENLGKNLIEDLFDKIPRDLRSCILALIMAAGLTANLISSAQATEEGPSQSTIPPAPLEFCSPHINPNLFRIFLSLIYGRDVYGRDGVDLLELEVERLAVEDLPKYPTRLVKILPEGKLSNGVPEFSNCSLYNQYIPLSEQADPWLIYRLNGTNKLVAYKVKVRPDGTFSLIPGSETFLGNADISRYGPKVPVLKGPNGEGWVVFFDKDKQEIVTLRFGTDGELFMYTAPPPPTEHNNTFKLPSRTLVPPQVPNKFLTFGGILKPKNSPPRFLAYLWDVSSDPKKPTVVPVDTSGFLESLDPNNSLDIKYSFNVGGKIVFLARDVVSGKYYTLVATYNLQSNSLKLSSNPFALPLSYLNPVEAYPIYGSTTEESGVVFMGKGDGDTVLLQFDQNGNPYIKSLEAPFFWPLKGDSLVVDTNISGVNVTLIAPQIPDTYHHIPYYMPLLVVEKRGGKLVPYYLELRTPVDNYNFDNISRVLWYLEGGNLKLLVEFKDDTPPKIYDVDIYNERVYLPLVISPND